MLNQQISLRLPKTLLSKLDKLAKTQRRKRSDLIRLYLETRVEMEIDNQAVRSRGAKKAPRRAPRGRRNEPDR